MFTLYILCQWSLAATRFVPSDEFIIRTWMLVKVRNNYQDAEIIRGSVSDVASYWSLVSYLSRPRNPVAAWHPSQTMQSCAHSQVTLNILVFFSIWNPFYLMRRIAYRCSPEPSRCHLSLDGRLCVLNIFFRPQRRRQLSMELVRFDYHDFHRDCEWPTAISMHQHVQHDSSQGHSIVKLNIGGIVWKIFFFNHGIQRHGKLFPDRTTHQRQGRPDNSISCVARRDGLGF